MLPYSVRTDLASEAHALYTRSVGKLDGVIAREEKLGGCLVTNVDILDAQAAEKLGKPVGRYCTLELDRLPLRCDPDFGAVCHALAQLIARCLPDGAASFLVAALGNPDITPDALGPLCAETVIVTRHLKHRMPEVFASMREVAVCRTGVLGTTGIESAAAVAALCRELKPDCVIAVDALAGARLDALCKSVQVCDSGIAPGSGVGNDRAALSRETLGVPVVALGVPTVTDASALGDGLAGLFVTSRSIDSDVRSAARLIGYALDFAFHPSLTAEEIFSLAV